MKTATQIACRYCHEGKMFNEIYDETFKFGRSSLFVEGLVRWRCNSCDSVMTNASQIEHNSELIEAVQQASPAFVSLGTLREFREKYNLTQRDASKLIGAGEGAFGKYESGEKLSAPTAKLIRVALALPEAAQQLAREAGMSLDFDETMHHSSHEKGQWTGGKYPYLRIVSSRRVECGNDQNFPSTEKPATSSWKSTRVKFA